MSAITAVIIWGGQLGTAGVLAVFAGIAFKEGYQLFRAFPVSAFLSFFCASAILFLSLGGIAFHAFFNHFSGTENPDWSLVLAIFLIGTKSQDIFAYFTGRLMGRHPLAPQISPHKTWEGAIGGVLGAAVLTGLMSYLLKVETPIPAYWYGMILGVGSLSGDLLESKIKRVARQKDSGQLIPGFGGLLDMIDSFIVSAPLSWFCWVFLGPVT